MLKDADAGISDIRAGLAASRIWTTLAWSDVRRRYRRSGLGQFWLTLSMVIMIGGLGYVYSGLFGIDITTYLPYISVTFVMWALISSIVLDSCGAFSENESLLLHMRLPRSLFVFRIMARNLVIAAHNVLIIPLVFVIFGKGFNFNIAWLAVGLLLVLLNAFWFGYFLAVICARFRDVPQIVASVMQIAFFITPVMFQPHQLAQRSPLAIEFNPFASLLAVVRDPLLGQMPTLWALGSSTAMALIGLLFIVPFAGRYAPRAVYWL